MKILTKLILISVGGFIFSVLIFGLLIRPNMSQVGNLYNEGIVKQTKQLNLSQQIIAYKNSESDLKAVQNKDKILTTILPRENLQVAIREIEAAALVSTVEQGMTIQETPVSTTPRTTTEVKQVITGNPSIEEVPYVITLSGSFPSLVTFLQYIEHLPHFTEVTKISLGAPTADTGNTGVTVHSGNLTGTINAIFFIKKPKP